MSEIASLSSWHCGFKRFWWNIQSKCQNSEQLQYNLLRITIVYTVKLGDKEHFGHPKIVP